MTLRASIIAAIFSLQLGTALAADRAVVECTGAPSPARMVAACTRLLHRRNLPPRLVAMILRNRGMGYESGGDEPHAFADFDAAARVDPAFALAFDSRALLFRRNGDLDRALADENTAIGLDPSSSIAFMDRALIWQDKGDLGRAIADFNKAIDEDPTNLAIRDARWRALYRQGNKAAALADLETLDRMAPGNGPVEAAITQLRTEIATGQGELGLQAPDRSAEALSQELKRIDSRIGELLDKKRYEDGLAIAKALEARVDVKTLEADPEYATVLGYEGILLTNLERTREGTAVLEHAQTVARRFYRPDSSIMFWIGYNLASAYFSLSRFDDAERLFKALFASEQATGESETVDAADCLRMSAAAASELGRFEDAETLVNRAIAIYAKTKGPDSEEMAMAMDVLGSAEKFLSRYDSAITLHKRAASIQGRLLGAESPEFASTLLNLASDYHQADRYAEAEPLERQVIAIYEKAQGAASSLLAKALANLANTLVVERHDQEAEATYRRAIAIFEKTLGPDNAAVGRAIELLASVVEDDSGAAAAEPLIRRSLEIMRRGYGADSPDVANIEITLARVLSTQKRYVEAAEVARHGLAVDRKTLAPNSELLMDALDTVAGIEKRLGRVENAEALYKEALDTRTTKKADTILLNSLMGYAAFLESQNRIPEAEASLARALAAVDSSLGRQHPIAGGILTAQARLAARRSDWGRALTLNAQAQDIAIHANDSGRQGIGRESFASDLAQASSQMVRSAWEIAAKDAGRRTALEDTSFQASQFAHRSAADTALAQMAARFGTGETAVAMNVRKQQDLSASATALDKKLTHALGTNDPDRETQVGVLRREIADNEKASSDLEGRLKRDFPAYTELANPRPLSIDDTRQLLGPDEALISWLILDKDTFVFAVTRDGSAWYRADLGAQGLGAAVKTLRAGLDMNAVMIAMATKKPARDVVFDLGVAHDLYERLIGPVAGLVGGKHDWIVVTSGALTSLPLDVLVSKAPDHAAMAPDDPVYRGAAWLARDHAISVLPSVSALRALRVYAKASHATKPLVGFADPVFDAAQLVASNGPPANGSASRGLAVKSYRSYFRGGAVDLDALRTGLPPLPETATELHEVAHELQASDADLRIGPAATVTAVKATALDQFHVVYFATHGLVAGDIDGLDEPALALSIPAKPTAADDGLLKASDVTQLTLDADWVVLSACNTAVGDTPGAEGLSGLARAFFYAGARALLVSHWPVESHAAVALTTQSFRAMAADLKLGRAEALRRSMLTLIDKGGRDAYPAIWAPFSVVGEGDRR